MTKNGNAAALWTKIYNFLCFEIIIRTAAGATTLSSAVSFLNSFEKCSKKRSKSSVSSYIVTSEYVISKCGAHERTMCVGIWKILFFCLRNSFHFCMNYDWLSISRIHNSFLPMVQKCVIFILVRQSSKKQQQGNENWSCWSNDIYTCMLCAKLEFLQFHLNHADIMQQVVCTSWTNSFT